jgi:glycosyltransferase involved in cell wall biosynthesis
MTTPSLISRQTETTQFTNALISVIILTYNEKRHLQRCIDSLKQLPVDVYVVDCGSTDGTQELAASMGAKVYANPWVNYATQFNWGLDNIPQQTDWVLRLDADEVVTPELAKFICDSLRDLPTDTNGVYVRRQMHFMGKWIRHGGMYPIHVLRLFRFGKGRCEQRWMDEHIKLVCGSKTVSVNADIIDNNLNSIGWWTQKHNSYATREAADLLNIKYSYLAHDEVQPVLIGSQEQRKRWLKFKYAKLPLFVRPFIYFIYRYFLLLGFLDGTQGLVWHFLQGFWYRFLVDAKVFEISMKCGNDIEKIEDFIAYEYGISCLRKDNLNSNKCK